MSGGYTVHQTIYLEDSNGDNINGVPIYIPDVDPIVWPPGTAELQGGPINFGTFTNAGRNFNSEVYAGDAFWKAAGIDILGKDDGDFNGAGIVIAAAAAQWGYDMTEDNPITIELMTDVMGKMILAHNTLAKQLHDYEYKVTHLAGSVSGWH